MSRPFGHRAAASSKAKVHLPFGIGQCGRERGAVGVDGDLIRRGICSLATTTSMRASTA
jgi:hypothetical protein